VTAFNVFQLSICDSISSARDAVFYSTRMFLYRS
jgi:hypothetical protein